MFVSPMPWKSLRREIALAFATGALALTAGVSPGMGSNADVSTLKPPNVNALDDLRFVALTVFC